MQEQPITKSSHNLFLHRFLDNDQCKSVALMRLDTHSTLYRDGVENKYVTNLVISGRNFIELYALFQNQLSLSMGTWHIFEDILQVQQWDRNIVITTRNKIVGLIYEDCIIKNSFMLTLQFLELGFRQPITVICDKLGFYMLVTTTRQMLLCISQRAVHRYKAKPFIHRKMSIIEESIKWNRPDYQFISDIVKFEFDNYEFTRVECQHFFDQYLYFIGYTLKSGNRKVLFQIPIEQIFSDNEKQSLILEFTKLDDDAKEVYIIRKDSESEFLIIHRNNNMTIKNQKGQFVIEDQPSKGTPDQPVLCRKSNNPQVFPIQLYHKNALRIYERSPSSSLSVPGHFSKRIIKLPGDLEVEYCDVQDGIFVYGNLYEVGLVFLKNLLKETAMLDEKDEKERTVLKEFFGNIVDFNIGQNTIVIENTHRKKCSIRVLRKGITESLKPFIMVPKKIALENIQNLKSIRSLQDLLHNEYELTEPEPQLKKIRQFLLNYLVIQTKNDMYSLYKLVAGPAYELVITGFVYWSLVKNYQSLSEGSLMANTWYLILWSNENQLLFYEIHLDGNNYPITLHKKIENLVLWRHPTTPLIYKIKQYFISTYQQELQLNIYNWHNNTSSTVRLPNEAKNTKLTSMRINYKSITFKKKDKDYFFLEVVAILDGQRLQIWEVSVDSGLFKISHCTDNVGEGLAILFPSESPVLNSSVNLFSHQFRAITCPQYVLSDKTISNSKRSPTIIKMHVLQYGTQNFLFLINSKEQLQVYKKIYCSNSNINSTFGAIDTGFLYYRQPLQLNLVKKFKYNEANAFTYIGCDMLRICNLVFFKGQLLEFQQNIRTVFKIPQQEVWAILQDGKLKSIITQGKIISHFLTTTIPSNQKQQIIGIESTNQNYVIYSRSTFEVYNKQLNLTWSSVNNFQDPILDSNQYINCICAYDHYVAVSYYNFCVEGDKGDEYQSIKFKLRIYNTITKKKMIEKEIAYEEPVLHIRYVAPDKLIVVTSSNISVNTIKNNQSLQNPKNKHYSKRAMLSCFSYHPEKVGIEPGYMLFGGLYGGLSFHVGQWVDKDRLDEMWYENLKCGVLEVQIFHYGDSSEMLKAVIADDSENIVVLDLKPKCAEKIADFHIGSLVNSIKKRNEIPYFSSQDGCIRMLLPIKLKDPQVSFLDLQDQITKLIPLLGGFNNRDSRLLDQRQKTYKLAPQGNLVDGELIRSFFSLTETLKNNIYEASELGYDNLWNQLLGQL